MQTHKASCLDGPITGTREWWRNVEGNENSAAEDQGRPFRADLVARIRKEIAAGTYETPEKLEVALARMLMRLEGDEA
jgi:hypothetical protein